MKSVEWRERIIEAWHRALGLARRVDESVYGAGTVLLGAVRQLLAFQTTISAAAIAYFALLSIFPLTLLSITIASYSLGPSANISAVIAQLEFLVPTLGDLMSENIAGVIRARGSVSVVAVIALAWSASSLFRGLGGILQDIWQSRYIRPFWQRYGIALTLIVLLVGPLLLAGLVAGSLLASLLRFLPDQFQFMAGGLQLLLALVLDVLLYWALYTVMPHGLGSWRDLLTGAVGAGLLWELAKRAFVAFVGTYMVRTNLVYGSVASIIAFLTWAYLSGLILLFGAYLSVACYRHRAGRQRNRLLSTAAGVDETDDGRTRQQEP